VQHCHLVAVAVRRVACGMHRLAPELEGGEVGAAELLKDKVREHARAPLLEARPIAEHLPGGPARLTRRPARRGRAGVTEPFAPTHPPPPPARRSVPATRGSCHQDAMSAGAVDRGNEWAGGPIDGHPVPVYRKSLRPNMQRLVVGCEPAARVCAASYKAGGRARGHHPLGWNRPQGELVHIFMRRCCPGLARHSNDTGACRH